MGSASLPEKVKLIAGLISSDVGYLNLASSHLSKAFGPLDFKSSVLNFASTKYYDEEFGSSLKRQILSFARLAKLEGIARLKLATNALEKTLSRHDKRSVNIDPGYLELSKVVLLTTKDYFHRIYLAKGIYGEVTLFYRDKTFNAFDWTYPDYRSREYIDIFNKIREIYRGDLEDVH